jgi:hypothetical protein
LPAVFGLTILLPGLLLTVFGVRALVQERSFAQQQIRERLDAAAQLAVRDFLRLLFVPPTERSRAFIRVGLDVRRRVRVIAESERAGFRRREQLARLSDVGLGYEDIDGSQAIDGQAVRLAQRLTAFGRRNPGRFEKRPNLLRLGLTAGHEHPLQL